MKRRWASVGIALGVVAAVLPVAAASTSAAPTNGGGGSGVGTIEWAPCNDGGFLDFVGAECGMLSVPLDAARPRGKGAVDEPCGAEPVDDERSQRGDVAHVAGADGGLDPGRVRVAARREASVGEEQQRGVERA